MHDDDDDHVEMIYVAIYDGLKSGEVPNFDSQPLAQALMTHAWEASLKSWEAELHDPDKACESDFEDDAFDEDAITPAMAAQELASMIIDMKHRGTISAKDACILSYWAAKSGVEGAVAQLAMRPGNPSTGNYSKHFDRVVNARGHDDELYVMRVPVYQRSYDCRAVSDVHLLPPLEAADEEIRGTPDMKTRLEECRDTGTLPPAYDGHAVVKGAPPHVPVYPFSLYVDAVQFQRTDAVIGFWLCSLVTGVRQLLVSLRKSELCACGCRGWCTIVCIMAMLNWSFLHMARGVAPAGRHDGSPWLESDAARAAIAGAALGWVGVVLFIKCDMMEYVTTFGFPSWSTSDSPCPLCFCSHSDWGAIAGISPVTLPWRLKTFHDYQIACSACEHLVHITSPDLFRTLRGSLEYDKRAGGSKGRSLLVDIPQLGLRKGDRLCPGGDITDVGQIDTLNPQSACRLLFWRRSAETFVRHRNPIFSEETGILPENVLVMDWLHTLSLGVYKYFISFVWHALFDVDAFSVGQCAPEEFFFKSVARLRAVLFRWYDDETAAGREHSRVQNLTPEMVGRSAAHKLGTWGAETNGLLLFTDHLLRTLGDKIRADALLRSMVRGCGALIGIHNIIKEHAGTIRASVAQAFADHVKAHLHAMRELQIPVRAKHHALSHMAYKLLEYGSPALWACWRDESENKLLAQLALRAHRSVWSRRLIAEHRLAFGTRRTQRLRL